MDILINIHHASLNCQTHHLFKGANTDVKDIKSIRLGVSTSVLAAHFPYNIQLRDYTEYRSSEKRSFSENYEPLILISDKELRYKINIFIFNMTNLYLKETGGMMRLGIQEHRRILLSEISYFYHYFQNYQMVLQSSLKNLGI